MPTYCYWCGKCEHITDAHYKLTEERPDFHPCEVCEGEAEYRLAAPMVLKASFLDGQRKNKGDWKDLREASKLNLAAASANTDSERSEISKESKKLGFNLKKDGPV